MQVGEKIRNSCAMHQFLVSAKKTISITCSIGIALHKGGPNYKNLIKEADSALFRAKEQGRNITIVA
jgi:diguanylate cyclase (GGDEF)-like protein